MDLTDAMNVSEFVRRSLVEAVNTGKDIRLEMSRGTKDVSGDTDTIRKLAPSGELNISLYIPADQ